MDINSRINWKPGMEITAEALKALSKESDARDLALLRSAFGSRVGILPNEHFKCEGAFVRKSFEFEVDGCTALLPSGRMIDVEDRSSIQIGDLSDGLHYLTVGIGQEVVEFERDTVPMSRPEYVYQIRSFSELGKCDELPLMRFSVKDGEISLDREYIVPCMQMVSDPRFAVACESLRGKMEAVSGHKNLSSGDMKRAMLQNMLLLKSLRPEIRVDEFILLTAEIANSVKYYVLDPNTEEHEEIPESSLYDVQLWLKWLDDYLGRAAVVLDGVEVKDSTIDVDALREQLRKELYETLQPELTQSVQEKMEALREEMQAQISEALQDFISGEFRRKLHDDLGVELNTELEQKLFSSLYQSLYDALFVPPKVEEDVYTPLI